MRFLPALRGTPQAAKDARPARVESTALVDRARVQAKEILLAAWYDTYGRAPDLGKPGDVKKLVEHYERCVWGYRAVEWIASNYAMLRVGARLRSDPGQEVDDPVLLLLNERANPYERAMFFRHRLMQQLLTSPRGVMIERVKTRRGTPAEFHLLPPTRTRPVPGRNGEFLSHFSLGPADGHGPVRVIEPENVIWTKLPHPTDPYRSMTPFEAANLSFELDYFARLYNRNFMHNDGRPGGILGVDSDLEDDEMDRVERKFGGGVAEAGRLSVIAGGLSYIDVASTPRDAQYVETARNAKIEVLAALGVSEASLGNSSDRTFSNAEVDDESSWRNQLPRFKFVIDSFDEDSGDDVELFHDLSEIDALGRAERRRREELRTEHDKGLISGDEYRNETGREETGLPAMRAYWVASGRMPVAAKGDDQAELTRLVSETRAAPAQIPAGGAQQDDDRPPLPAQAPGRGDPDAEKPDTPPGRERPFSGTGAAGAPEAKAAPASSSDGPAYEPDDDDGAELEKALRDALLASVARLAAVAETRLNGPKARQHTRHWSPPGDKPLNARAVVQVDRWRDAAVADAERVLAPAAEEAAAELIAALAPEGKALPKAVADAVRKAVEESAEMVGKSAARQADLLLDLIADTDAGGASIPDIVAAVRKYAKGQGEWAGGVAVHAVTAALEGARAAAAATVRLPGRDVVRRWRTRGDDKVRGTHRTANGQERALGDTFDIGGADLRYPGDPKAPFKETANCFPAGTLVRATGVEVAFRRWYEGEVVTIHTANGHVLTGTPNHPVLTEGGWVALGEVEEGDDLVCEVPAPADGLVGAPLPDVEDAPARIEEVYRAAEQAGVAARVAGAGVDFHGDGREGEVDVVRADRPLQVGVPAAGREQPGETHLAAADAFQRALAAESAGGELVLAGRSSSRGAVRGGSEGYPPVLPGAGGAEPHGVGTSAARDSGESELPVDGVSGHAQPRGDGLLTETGLVQRDHLAADAGRVVTPGVRGGGALVAQDDAGAPKPGEGGGSRPPKSGGDVVHPLASLVRLTRVTKVVRGHLSGHVYNLQTETGVYLANGIVSHNCRCRLQYRSVETGRFVPKPRGEVDRRPRVKVLIRHPDPVVGVAVKARRVPAGVG